MQYRLSPYRWLILGLIIISYAIVFLQRMSPTVMADAIMTDFQVGGAFMGMLAAAYFYPYALMQIPSGLLSDRTSPRILIFLAMLFTAVGSFIFAYASSANIALVGRVVIGFAVSIVLMPAYKALANWFTAKAFVVIISSVMAIAGGLGSMFAGAPLSWLTVNMGWRMTSIGLGCLCLLLSVIIYFFFKDSPVDMGLPLPEKPKEEVKNDEVQEEKVSIKEGLKFILGMKNYWLLAIPFFLNGAVYFSFNGLWAGKFFIDVCALTRAEMSTLLSMSAAVAIVAPILFASLSNKITSYKKILIIYAIIFLTMLSWLYLRYDVWTKPEIYVWGLLLPSICSLPPALFFASIRQIVPANISGTASGLLYSMPMMGSAIFQPLIGIIIDSAGFTDVLTIAMFENVALLYFASAVLSIIAIFLLKEENSILLSK